MDIAAILKVDTPSMKRRRDMASRLSRRTNPFPDSDVAGIPSEKPMYAEKPVKSRAVPYPVDNFLPPPSY